MRSAKSSDRPSAVAPANASAKRTNLQRRGFLLTLGAGGAGVVAVAANKLAGSPVTATAEPIAQAESKGYALNDHIRRYYQTAKL